MIPFKLASPNKIQEEVYAGDTWRGFTVRGSAGGEVPTDTLPAVSSAKLQFRTTKGRLVYELNSSVGSVSGLPTGYPDNTMGNITIEDAAEWTIAIDAQPLEIPAGIYLWDLEVTDILNTKRTILKGRITICADITQ